VSTLLPVRWRRFESRRCRANSIVTMNPSKPVNENQPFQ
jgi:hypothetical protein